MRENFVKTVRECYQLYGRHDLPWRIPESDGSFDPYKVMVSEIMLQQTQVSRVTPKYQDFLEKFPTVQSLAAATLGDVLVAWQGLGYNRRAKYLWQAAKKVRDDFGGNVPRDQKRLETLPGIGANTAGAILAYSFNVPVVFIETNIRTVFIHRFFTGQTAVPDAAIRRLVEETLDHDNPREWYWALMDYGSYLKQTVGNASRSSKTYTKQSAFHGSLRQIRGRILRELAEGVRDEAYLKSEIGDNRVQQALGDLEREGMIVKHKQYYRLP